MEWSLKCDWEMVSIMETGQSKDPTKARLYMMHLNIHLVLYEEWNKPPITIALLRQVEFGCGLQ